jgi:hypothetical protein
LRRFPRKYICIDVDTEGEKLYQEDPLREVKAFYQLSHIPRIIMRTRHGYHVYLLIEIDEKDLEKHLIIRYLFGDDRARWGFDYNKYLMGKGVLNKCFTSTELYEVKI